MHQYSQLGTSAATSDDGVLSASGGKPAGWRASACPAAAVTWPHGPGGDGGHSCSGCPSTLSLWPILFTAGRGSMPRQGRGTSCRLGLFSFSFWPIIFTAGRGSIPRQGRGTSCRLGPFFTPFDEVIWFDATPLESPAPTPRSLSPLSPTGEFRHGGELVRVEDDKVRQAADEGAAAMGRAGICAGSTQPLLFRNHLQIWFR